MTLRVPELPEDCDTLRAALLYAEAGWYVLPVNPRTKHAGSVLGKGWQDKSSRDPQQIAAWFAGEDYGLALHVGRSGAVVFDVDDPQAAPAELVAAVRDLQPPSQATRTPDTGRGHYVFAAEAGTIGNSVGELGPGWGDVRGLNGIVVVAPTLHEKADQGGLYAWRSTGAVPTLPETLRARLRPPGGGAGAVDAPGLQAWLAALPAGDPSPAVLDVPVAVPAAQRHDAMLDAVLRLVRLAEQGHAGVYGKLVALGNGYIEAVKADRGGADVAKAEFQRAVAGAVGIVAASPTPNMSVTGELADLAAWWWEQHADVPFDLPAAEPEPLDLTKWTVSPAQLIALPRPDPIIPGVLYRDRLAWLIGKSGSFKSFVALDLAAAVADENGRKWLGRPVYGGPVLYIVAEGIGGMGLRIAAWTQRHGPMSERLRLFPRAVQVNSPGWAVLVELARQIAPALIVVDTQARVTTGINENSNGEVGQMIGKLDELREATRACVLIVHHVGRHGTDARGASAIDGAQDTELKVERVGGSRSLRARLTSDKQKDAPDDIEIDLQLESIDLGVDPATGEHWSSLVVSPDVISEPFVQAPYNNPDVTNRNQAMIMDILRELFDEDGGTRSDVAKAWKERGGWAGAEKWPHNTFYRAWDALLRRDLIGKITGTQRFRIVRPEE